MFSFPACFFRGAFGACVVLLATAVIVPQYADYKERAATTEMFNESVTLRQAVEARILELGGIQNSGTGVQVPSASNYRANLTRDGIII
jgi:Tfp pilus assembly major pilin PilA